MKRENFDSFMARFVNICTPAELGMLQVVYALSKHAHRHEVRREKDVGGNLVRYFEHPRAAALILFDEMGIVDVGTICLALLHDVLEDTCRLDIHALSYVLGNDQELIRSLILLTKTPQNKKGYYERLVRHGSKQVLLVKVADRLHNLRTLGDDPVVRQKQIEDTSRHFSGIIDALLAKLEQRYVEKWHDQVIMCTQEILGYYEPHILEE